MTMGEIVHDVRLAIRSFWKTPVFTVSAILTLTLAIGANTAIFSILNALVLRDLPVREPSSLISIARVTRATADGAFSLPLFRAIAERQQSLSSLIGWTSNSVINIEIDDERTRGNVSAVTGNYFAELGIRPLAGRLLTDADVSVDTQRSAPIAVIGHAFWQRHFNRDPAAVGRTVRVEGTPFTIVGVAPAGFTGLGLTLEIDVAVPLTFVPLVRDVPDRAFLNGTVHPISLTGRLRPGVTIDQARAELTTLWPAILTAVIPTDYAGAQRQRFLETTIRGPSRCKRRRAGPAPAIHAATRGRDGDRAVRCAHRVRQHRQPHDVAGVVTDARDGHPCRTWGGTLAADAPRARRRCHAVARRRALGVFVAMWGSESLVASHPGHIVCAAII